MRYLTEKRLKKRRYPMSTTKDKLIQVLVSHIKAGVNLKDLSLSQIATEAEIGKSTVYEHFASKEAMISDTYAYLLKSYEAILLEPISQKTFKAAFIEQLSRILTVMKDAKVIMDAIMNNTFDQIPNLKPEHQCLIETIQLSMGKRFEQIIKMAIDTNEIDIKKIKPYSKHVIQALISGILLQYVKNEIDMSEQAVCDMIYEQILKSIN